MGGSRTTCETCYMLLLSAAVLVDYLKAWDCRVCFGFDSYDRDLFSGGREEGSPRMCFWGEGVKM